MSWYSVIGNRYTVNVDWRLVAGIFSNARTGLLLENKATQAKAWPKFSRPFGPLAPKPPITEY